MLGAWFVTAYATKLLQQKAGTLGRGPTAPHSRESLRELGSCGVWVAPVISDLDLFYCVDQGAPVRGRLGGAASGLERARDSINRPSSMRSHPRRGPHAPRGSSVATSTSSPWSELERRRQRGAAERLTPDRARECRSL